MRAISTARLCRAGANRSSQSRLGRITSAQISTSSPGLRCGSGFARSDADQPAPVRLILRAAGPPPLLPALAGPCPQPAQHRQHPQPPGLLTEPVVQRERRGQHPGEHLGAGRLGRWPRRRGRSGRERRRQLRPGRVRRSGHRGRGDRRAGDTTCSPAVTTGPRRRGSPGSPRGSPPPAARPGRGRVGGHGKPAARRSRPR